VVQRETRSCFTNKTTSTTHKLPAISDLTYVQRLGNRIDDEDIANNPDEEDASIKDDKYVSKVGQEGVALHAAPILGAHQSRWLLLRWNWRIMLTSRTSSIPSSLNSRIVV